MLELNSSLYYKWINYIEMKIKKAIYFKKYLYILTNILCKLIVNFTIY